MLNINVNKYVEDSQKGINHQDKKCVKVFFTTKDLQLNEITSIGTLKRVLIKADGDRKTIDTIAQVLSNDYSKNFFKIKGYVSIVNLYNDAVFYENK